LPEVGGEDERQEEEREPRERRQAVLVLALRSTTDHEASKMWWMRIIISIPIAMAVQKPKPTSQEVATTWAPETRIPSAVTAMPATPIPRAFVESGTPACGNDRGGSLDSELPLVVVRGTSATVPSAPAGAPGRRRSPPSGRRGQLVGVGVHLALAVRDRVEDLALGHLAQPVVVVARDVAPIPYFFVIPLPSPTAPWQGEQ
jgi:hypothetical protein